jgi:UDP-N-acetylmuramate: L-alanyl-gamma-D-glutamyl-meso-diaminopimelate ligase
VPQAIAALKTFSGVARRMQVRGEVNGIRVYDDFAHHPTAIHTTLDGLRRRVGDARIVAVLEARSNTMKMGVHRDTLAPSLALADEVWLFAPPDLGWDTKPLLAALGARGHGVAEVDAMADQLANSLRPGDHALIMSNGGFGGLHGKLLAKLETRFGRR